MTIALRVAGLVKRWPALHAGLRPMVRRYYAARPSVARFVWQWRQRLQRPANRGSESPPAVVDTLRLHDVIDRADVRGIGKSACGREVVMLVVSDLRIDPRVEREARILAGAGYTVRVLCPDPTQGKVPGLKLDWGPGVEIEFLHWTAASFMTRAPGYVAEDLFSAAIRRPPFAYHAHDLSTAYAGLAAARLTGAHLIVDFHEWTSENVHWDYKRGALAPYPTPWKLQLAALEARCLSEASAVITVCDSIADGMASEVGDGRRPLVVRNIPPLTLQPTRPYLPLKEQLGLPADTFVLLWQGGTGPTRLIEPIIEALSFMPRCTFVIRGPSLDLFGSGYRDIAERVGAADRLILLPPVPSRDVVAAGRGADAGVWTLPNLCRNFRMALPNKIFEYLASGLPIVVADYPEARKIAEDHGVGVTFDPYDPRSIAAAINRLAENSETLVRVRAAVPEALARLHVDSEWSKLADLYKSLPQSGP
jgi:glycosyltransferase involved in cell wall biosynthesis